MAGRRRARPASSAGPNRRGPLRGLLRSESVSRILSGAAIHLCGPPGPRRAGSEVLLGLAPGGVCHARLRHRGAGALLPHRFTLTCARLTCGRAIGGLFSVALSRGFPRVGVTHRPALWCPDFPRRLLSSPRLPNSHGQDTSRHRDRCKPAHRVVLARGVLGFRGRSRDAAGASGELGPAGLAT
jgi:hypothetical protein